MLERKTLRTRFHRRTTLVAIFETHRALIDVYDRALASGLDDVLDIGSAALVTRDERGEPVTINNSVTRRDGMFSGAMLGVAFGGLAVLLGGALVDLPEAAGALSLLVGVLLGGAIGALLGRAVAGMTRFGFEASLLRRVERQLQPGQVALLLQVRPSNLPVLRRELGTRAALFSTYGAASPGER